MEYNSGNQFYKEQGVIPWDHKTERYVLVWGTREKPFSASEDWANMFRISLREVRGVIPGRSLLV